jgi:hypothetical protein
LHREIERLDVALAAAGMIATPSAALRASAFAKATADKTADKTAGKRSAAAKRRPSQGKRGRS